MRNATHSDATGLPGDVQVHQVSPQPASTSVLVLAASAVMAHHNLEPEADYGRGHPESSFEIKPPSTKSRKLCVLDAASTTQLIASRTRP
jgi:hypothetical protein